MGKKLRNAVARLEKSAQRLPNRVQTALELILKPVYWLFGSIVGGTSTTPRVGLTFDDGPDSMATELILDVLAERQVKASFFMLAERAEERPDLVRRIVEQGHEACLHGANHDNLTRLGTREAATRIRGGKARLEKLTGTRLTLFRPPYGAQNLRTLMITRMSRMTPVMWTALGDDWKEQPPSQIAHRSMENLHGGGILLLHDGFEPNPDHPTTRPTYDRVEMVRLVLDAIEERGLEPTTVSRVLSRGSHSKKLWFEY